MYERLLSYGNCYVNLRRDTSYLHFELWSASFLINSELQINIMNTTIYKKYECCHLSVMMKALHVSYLKKNKKETMFYLSCLTERNPNQIKSSKRKSLL